MAKSPLARRFWRAWFFSRAQRAEGRDQPGRGAGRGVKISGGPAGLRGKRIGVPGSMANTKSAKKAARQAIRRTEINKARRSSMRTSVRKVEEAIAAGDQAAALAAMKAAEPLLRRAAQKGVTHKNTAARKVSRLVRRIRTLAQ